MLATGLLAPGVFGQASVPPQASAEDQSFYLDQPVVHPEALSGVWETSDGEGGVVGIRLRLMTTLPDDAEPPVWSPQSWQHLEVDVFERKGGEPDFGEAKSFSDSIRGGRVTFNNQRLQLHSVSAWKNAPSIDLDVVEQADGCWHGQFHRGAFDSVVALCRPTPGSGVARSPLVGTWFERPSTCIHIAQTGPATFTGWSDSLMIPGRVSFAATVPGPHQLFEDFGSLAKVEVGSDGEVSLVFGAYGGICCPYPFTGRLSSDGATLQGEFPSGPNQSPRAATFIKMRGDSCVEPAALRRREAVCATGAK